MKKILVKVMAAIALMMGLGGMNMILVDGDASAATGTGKVNEYLNATDEKSNRAGSGSEYANNHKNDLMNIISIIIDVVIGIVGLIAVVMIIVGGISFATSQGDAQKVAKGKNTLLYGIVGLVVAILAFAIVNFVLGQVFEDLSQYDTEAKCEKADHTWDATSKTCK